MDFDNYQNSNLLICTSDRPVLLGTSKLDDPVGFQTDRAMLCFPLSPDLCLVGRNVGKGGVRPCNNVSNPCWAEGIRVLMRTKSLKLIIASDASALPPVGTEIASYVPANH